VPQYGGTLTVWLSRSDADPPSPDMMDGNIQQTDALNTIQQMPLVGDFVRYGPRGTGEFAFQMRGYNPLQFMKGELLESWEISEGKVVWHVRQGVYWQGLCMGRRVMEDRELTAADIVADLIYFKTCPGGKGFKEMAGDIYATDRYTLVIEFSKGFDFTLMYVVGYEDRAAISPPEIEGSKNWEEQVGTGPFMLKEYVVGSHITFARNPNYWETATINGVEYPLPFIDEMIWPIIPDESTQIAALRTGAIDWSELVAASYWSALDKTAPGLLSAKVAGASTQGVRLKCNVPPFDDVNVRRAMMIGTDIKAHIALLGAGPLQIDFFPAYPGDPAVYTPMAELPAETRLLYDYNPTLAKKMLADAGYPDGLTIELVSQTPPATLARASLLADQWEKIGVKVEIKAVDDTTFGELRYARTYKHAILTNAETGGIVVLLTRFFRTGEVLNFSDYSNKRVDELIDMMKAEMDIAEQNRLAKEAALIVLNEVSNVPLQPGLDGHYWWPWLKNYYGERNVRDWCGPQPILAQIWIDQALKAEMGYK